MLPGWAQVLVAVLAVGLMIGLDLLDWLRARRLLRQLVRVADSVDPCSKRD